MPQRVVLDDELRGDRRAEAQREWRGLVELFIRERAYRGGRFTAVAAQEFERGGLALRRPVRWACLALISATTSQVTSVTALPLATARATSISIGYMLATWCTMTPTERRSYPTPVYATPLPRVLQQRQPDRQRLPRCDLPAIQRDGSWSLLFFE